MRSYRSRSLTQKCQVAKDDGFGNPVRDDKGSIVLEHGGLWFLKVSGAENHDRKRLLPEDHKAFFEHKSKEIEEALKAEGITDASVTPDDLYAEYSATFTKPAHTHAPAGKPEEFSIVLPKTLCVNWRGSIGTGGGGVRTATVVAPQHTSIFARLKAAAGRSNTTQPPSATQPAVKKTK